MKRKRNVLLLAVVLMTVVVVSLLNPREPKYQGKSLTEWLLDADTHPDFRGAASNAVRSIGPRAIPTLLKLLQARDPPFKQTIVAFWAEHTELDLNVTFADELRGRGVFGFEALGSNAVSAMPQLVGLLSDTNAAVEAVYALACIGPEATSSLISALTNRNIRVRAEAALCLSMLASNRAEVIPALLKTLNDPEPQVRSQAALSLAHIRPEAGVVVPPLMALLSDPDEQVRRIAAAALSLYGPKAAQAIPALERLFLDPSVQVRRGATNALKKIIAKRSSELKPDGTSGNNQ